jgi:hypothetical protein
MALWGLTHYKTEGPERHIGFELGTCENCGRLVQEANAVTLCEPEKKLQYFGLKEWEGELPPEIFWSDELNMSVCEVCE